MKPKIDDANAIPGEALFPTLADLAGKRDVGGLAALAPGPVADWDDLLRRHVDLLSEDFLGALGAQVRELRADPAKLDSLACYAVQAAGSVCQVRDRFEMHTGREKNGHRLQLLT